jgi:leucyl aminopeptidase
LTGQTREFKRADDQVKIASAALTGLDESLKGVLAELLAGGGFEGKAGQSTRAVRVLGAPAAHVALAGLGKGDKLAAVAEWGQGPFQSLGASVAALCKANKLKAAGLAFLSPPGGDAGAAVQRVVAGALQGGYESTRCGEGWQAGSFVQVADALGSA